MLRIRSVAAVLSASVATLAVLSMSTGDPKPAPASAAPIAPDAVAVNGSAPLLPPEIVRIAGDVAGLPQGSAASIVVKVNGVPVPSRVDGASYTADILAAPSAIVTVEAYAPRVMYRSVPATVARLALHAGADGLLTVDEYEGVRVSPWSTAVAISTERLLGQAARDDDQVAQARRMLATPDAWQSFASSHTEHELGAMAEAMLRYADGRLALPSGKATGHDVVSDAPVFASEVSKVAAPSRDHVARSGHRQRIASMDSLPARLLLASKAGPADSLVASRHVLLLSRTGPGTVRVHMSEFSDVFQSDGTVLPGTPMPEFTASITAEGDMRLVPLSRLAWTITADNGRTEVELEAMELRRLADGPVSLWALALDTKATAYSRPDLGTVPRRQWSVVWGGDLQVLARPVSWNGNVAVRTHCLQAVTSPGTGRALKTCETAELRLLSGSQGRMEDTAWKVDSRMRPLATSASATTFTWSSLDAGTRVLMTLPSMAMEAWVIGGGDAAADLVLVRSTGTASDVAGQSALLMTPAVVGGFVPIDTAGGAGHWRLAGSYLDYLYPSPYQPSYFVRHGDGQSSEYLERQGLAGPASPSAWESHSGRLYDTRFRARFPTSPQQRAVTGCAQAFAEGATECAPTRVRYFKAMSRIGNRIYGYTDFYHNAQLYPAGHTGGYTIVRSGGGPTYYDCEQGGCLTPSPAALESQPATPIRGGAPSRSHDDAHLRLRMRRLRP